MALTNARNQLLLLAGVSRADGETEPTPEELEQADQAATIVRFDWTPGNGTRYRLTYTIRLAPVNARPHPTSSLLKVYGLNWHGATLEDGRKLPASAGRSFEWDEYSHLNGPWFAQTMGINQTDADGLLLLLDALGHSLSYCADEPGRTVPQPRTPVLVEQIEGVTNANA